MSVQVTHVEYHPLGSEESIRLCRAIGIDQPSSQRLILSGVPEVITEQTFQRIEANLLELASPILSETNQMLVAAGMRYCNWLMVIVRQTPKPIEQAVQALLNCEPDVHGVRFLPLAEVEFARIESVLGAQIREAFDREIRKAEPSLVIATAYWRILRRHPTEPPLERAGRGLLIARMHRDEELERRIGLEYQQLDGLEPASIKIRAAELLASTQTTEAPEVNAFDESAVKERLATVESSRDARPQVGNFGNLEEAEPVHDVEDLKSQWPDLMGGRAMGSAPEPTARTEYKPAEQSAFHAQILEFPVRTGAQRSLSLGDWDRERRLAGEEHVEIAEALDLYGPPEVHTFDGLSIIRSRTANNQLSIDVELSEGLADEGDVLIMQLPIGGATETVLFILFRPEDSAAHSPLIGAQRFDPSYDTVEFVMSLTPACGVSPELLGDAEADLIAASMDRSDNDCVEAWKSAARRLPQGHPVRTAVVKWVRGPVPE